MGEIVNLRRVRRERARAEAAQLAAENQARRGRSKGELQALAKVRERLDKEIDGARLDSDRDGEPGE